MDSLDSITTLPDVSFIDDDTLDAMRIRLVSNFESEYKRITGKDISLALADPNRIILNAISLELYQVEQYVDRAGKQDLLKYSYGDFLDNLAAGRGVKRIQPSPAKTTMRFTLSEAKTYPIGVPEGTLITNGDLYFATDEYAEITAGTLSVEVNSTCTESGVEGNDILPGQIDQMVDLIAYVEKVENTTTTSGGCGLESDAELAERVYLAPASYSVAGPDDAYKYWTKAFNASIGDINITSPNPVEVEIRLLMNDGSLPTKTLLEELEEFLDVNNVRPLTDKVTALAPETTDFNIQMTYYINQSDRSKAQTIQSEVQKAVSEYIEWQTHTIGRDINPSELTSRVMSTGVKRVEITEPAFTVLDDTVVARLNDQTVTYGGVERD